MAIERNAKLRAAYFKAHPTAICDACQMDAAKRFPWAKAMLEIHHLTFPGCGTSMTAHVFPLQLGCWYGRTMM